MTTSDFYEMCTLQFLCFSNTSPLYYPINFPCSEFSSSLLQFYIDRITHHNILQADVWQTNEGITGKNFSNAVNSAAYTLGCYTTKKYLRKHMCKTQTL